MSVTRTVVMISTWIILSVSVVLVGCSSGTNYVRGYDCSELSKTFFRKPLKTRMADFSNYEVEEQYAIFICGNQYIHPPTIYLAEPFAREGENIVVFLKSKLVAAPNDPTVRDIVLVFSEMSRQKAYDVAADKNLMKTMEEKVSEIKNPEWRKLSVQDLNEIRSQAQQVN